MTSSMPSPTSSEANFYFLIFTFYFSCTVERENIRTILNTLFLIIAVIGLIVYFCYPSHHIYGLSIIGVAMVLKVAEFFIRFML